MAAIARRACSNAYAEAFNGKSQTAKTRARGYATTKHMSCIIYLIAGKLTPLPTNPMRISA